VDWCGDLGCQRALNTDGEGWGQEFIVGTIPTPATTWLSDIDAADLVFDGMTQTGLVVSARALTAGESGIIVANPQTSRIVYQGPVSVPLPNNAGSISLNNVGATGLGKRASSGTSTSRCRWGMPRFRAVARPTEPC
jgi:hypothetical protein